MVLSAACSDVPDHPSAPVETVEGSGVRTAEIAAGLDRPVHVAAAPGEPGRLYVVGQDGIIRVLDGGMLRPEPFLDISALVRTSPKGAFASEQGLLSMAFAGDYPRSGLFYVAYTDREGRVNVVEYRATGGRADAGSARPLLLVPKRSERHHGGQLQVGPDGALYASLGDDAEPRSHPQSLDPVDPLGKILRLDGDRWAVVAHGLRNPWRFSFDRETGDLWVGDVGESRWEEVSVIAHGRPEPVNLGWPAYEGHEAVEQPGGGREEPGGPGPLVWPAAVYGHDAGCAVTGGYVYRGESVPALRGRYVFGDYCTGAVWSLDPADPGSVRHELDLGATLASFGEDGRGELYLVSRTGRIFRLEAV